MLSKKSRDTSLFFSSKRYGDVVKEKELPGKHRETKLMTMTDCHIWIKPCMSAFSSKNDDIEDLLFNHITYL
jgi:hypothetical protein